MGAVVLPAAIVEALLTQARGAPTVEICGLIAGRDGNATRSLAIRNVAADPERRFEMAPRALIDAMRAMRENGEDLWAIYHSHPEGPDRPSRADLEEAAYPEAYYLILAPSAGGAWRINGFRLGQHGFHPVALREAP